MCFIGFQAPSPEPHAVKRTPSSRSDAARAAPPTHNPPGLPHNHTPSTRRDAPAGYYDEPAQAYLTEPTEEFKEAEKLRAAYREKTKEIRKIWDPEFAKFQEAKTDADRITALKRLEYLILGNQGLPPGLRLTDFITLCRRVKAKATQTGGWKTDTEIAYMDMIRSIKKAENPNYKEENYL